MDEWDDDSKNNASDCIHKFELYYMQYLMD